MAKLSNKQIAIIGVAIAGAAYAAWRLFINPTTAHAQEVEPANKQPAKGESDFPLQVGSKGEKVRELQIAIGATNLKSPIDGIFGAKTEAAVNDILHKKTINSQADIDTILSKREAAENRANGSKRADEILQKFKGSNSLSVMFTNPAIGEYYKQDYSGAMVFNKAKNLQFKPSFVFDRANLQVVGKTVAGYLQIKYRSNTYRVSPQDVTLVEPSKPSVSVIQTIAIAAQASMW